MGTYRTQYITTQKVMIIQLNFVDNFGIKLKSKCIPLQNFDININGQTKKYELHYIIEHIGSNLNSGHYMSYFKKNNTWYCANDTIGLLSPTIHRGLEWPQFLNSLSVCSLIVCLLVCSLQIFSFFIVQYSTV